MKNDHKLKRVLAVTILLAILILSATVYYKISDLRGRISAISRLPRNIDVSLRTVTYSETRDGVRKWLLEAQQADVAQKDNNIFLNNPRFTVYLDHQPEIVILTAGKAVYNMKTRNITLTDKVTAVTNDRLQIDIDKIFYDAAHSFISSNEHVIVRHHTSTVEGDGLELYVDTGTIKLLRNVTAIVNQERS